MTPDAPPGPVQVQDHVAAERVSNLHMAQRVRNAVAISASTEKVFAFLDVPENTLALTPQLVEVKEVVPLSNGGYRLRFVTLGRRGKLCEWVSEHIERVPYERVVVRAQTEGVTTIATRSFEKTPEGSLLSGTVEYSFDVPWPQRLLLPLMEFQARRPMRAQLGNVLQIVKRRVEAA